MQIDIYLIRHAESDLNITPNIIQGRSNSAKLSDNGKKQAEKLGERLLAEGIKFDAVYSSTADRAYETARIACEKTAYPHYRITRLEQLVEMSHGDWEGKQRNEIYTRELRKDIAKDAYNFCPPNGESMKIVEERMHSALITYVLPLPAMLFENKIAKKAERVLENRLIKHTKVGSVISGLYGLAKGTMLTGGQKEHSSLAVFSHAMAIKCFLRKIMGFTPEMTYRMRMFNTGISVISYTEKGWFPLFINDGSHIAGMSSDGFVPVI